MLKASYGYNGLGNGLGASWDSVGSEDYPSWTAGIQLTIPLGGNIKGRNDLKGARLHLQEAYMNLKGIETEMANSLSTSIQKARAWQQSIQSYQTMVHYKEKEFQTQLERLKSGTVESQTVLDAEADRLDSRQELAGALSSYHKALLEIELADGALLQDNNVEITPAKNCAANGSNAGQQSELSDQKHSAATGRILAYAGSVNKPFELITIVMLLNKYYRSLVVWASLCTMSLLARAGDAIQA